MSLADFLAIGQQLFADYVPLWAIVFLVVCVIVAILLSLVMLALSRV